jgi:hypothetical protein
MSKVVIYDPNDSVIAGRVVKYNPSAHTPRFQGQPNTLVNPDFSAVEGLRWHQWKVVDNEVIPITQDDIDALTAYILNSKSDLNKINKLEKASFLVMLDYINEIRTELSLATKSVATYKTDVKSKYSTL